jgi:DNA repair protein RadC
MQETSDIAGPEDWATRDPGQKPRPEERIVRAGAETLYDHELLAVLLGIEETSADRLLELHQGQLNRLFSADSCAAASLSPIRQARFLAARELACRLAGERVPPSDPLQQPEDVARYLLLRYGVRDQEILGALFLNNAKALITHHEIYRGTLARISAEPREILKQARWIGAAATIVFHTHPSGDPTPSPEDHAFTRQLADAARLLGIPLLDHLILGSAGRWTSMRNLIAW